MTEPQIDLSGVHLLSNDGALSAKHERVAQIIKDYDPNLELVYIPKVDRTTEKDHKEPFAVVHTHQGYRYVVMTCREDEVDERLVARLFKHNIDENDVLGALEAEEAAKRLMEYQARMDEMEMKRDFAKSLIKSKKHYYRHNGRTYS